MPLALQERVTALVPNAVFVSTETENGLDPSAVRCVMRCALADRCRGVASAVDGKLLAEIHQHGEVLDQRSEGEQMVIRARLPSDCADVSSRRARMFRVENGVPLARDTLKLLQASRTGPVRGHPSACAAAHAQGTSIVPPSDLVYADIDRLAELGMLGLSHHGQRPYSRREIARIARLARERLDRAGSGARAVQRRA